MSLNAAPAGMLEPLDQFLILPEVTDGHAWRSPDFIYGDAGKHCFTYMNYIDFGMLRNTNVLPDLKIDTLDALLDPPQAARSDPRRVGAQFRRTTCWRPSSSKRAAIS